MSFVLICAGGITYLSYAILAFTHINDGYQISFVSGVHASLAQSLNDGVFYPFLFDGEHYGGTRYMPLSFVPYAGLAWMTGEYLIAGKSLTFILTVSLCVQLYLIVRAFGCGRGPAVCLSSFVLITQSGFLASTTIRSDLLPIVLQLTALMIVWKKQSNRAVILAAVFCVLAVFAKFTAVWAVMAIGWRLRARGSRHLGILFVATWIGCTLAGMIACQMLSGGRMLENISALAGAGFDRMVWLRGPNTFLTVVCRGGLVTSLCVPFIVLGCARAFIKQRWTIYHSAALTSVPILVAIMTDMGAVFNHGLDVVVLGIVMMGWLCAEFTVLDQTTEGTKAAVAFALCWVALAGWIDILQTPLRKTCNELWSGQRSYPRVPLVGKLPAEGPILSEDPWVEVSRGAKPILVDPYSIARLTRSQPRLIDPLLRRIERGEFRCIVLLHRLDGPRADDNRWQDANLGWLIVRAIESTYRLADQCEGYFIYVPKS